MNQTAAALDALLSQPDPVDLVGRGHHVTQPGDPRRRETVFKPLMIRWLQHHYIAKDPAPFIGKARKGFRLHIADRRKRVG